VDVKGFKKGGGCSEGNGAERVSPKVSEVVVTSSSLIRNSKEEQGSRKTTGQEEETGRQW